MAEPIVIQTEQPHWAAHIVMGALAGVLAWWLIETISKTRDDDDDASEGA